MKIFSPSQTTNFLTCPMLWSLSRQGWRSKTFNKATLYAVRGSAVSSGLETLTVTGSLDSALVSVEKAVSEEWDKNKIDKREFVEFKSLPLSQKEITTQSNALVTAYAASPITVFEVLHSEYTFKNHGYARADLIGKLNNGSILPVDFKVKDQPVQKFYEYTTKQEFKYSWQMYHYCLAVSAEFNTDCLQFGIVILWYDKKPKIEYVPFHITPVRFKLWYKSAIEVWARMEAMETGQVALHEVAEHRTKFGPCEFTKACLEHDRDPDLMRADYFNIKE